MGQPLPSRGRGGCLIGSGLIGSGLASRWPIRGVVAGLLGAALVVGVRIGSGGQAFAEIRVPFPEAKGVLKAGAGLVDLPNPEERRSQDGVLDTTLTVGKTINLIGGRLVETWTYERSTPGPTLRVRPGDRLRVRLVNDLGRPGRHEEVPCGRRQAPKAEGPEQDHFTNIHTHGLQTSPLAYGDNPFIHLRPGEVCQYEFDIPRDHPSGLFFYHPHGHPSSLKQMWGGLGGAIVVEGELDEIPEVKAAKERVLVLQELFLDRRNQVPKGIPIPVGGHAPFTTVPSVETEIIQPINGVYRPTMLIRPGETQRWRIVNSSPHRFFLLSLEGHTLYQLARDGLSLPQTTPTSQILVSPGNRFEVVVKGGPLGVYKLKALSYDQGHPGGALPELHLATVVSLGLPTDGKLPGALIPQPDLRNEPVVRTRSIDWDGNIVQAPVQFFINHLQFDEKRVDEHVPADGVEEWTLRNNDVFQHNFHIHVNPFQVVEVNGKPFSEPGGQPSWFDTFPLPPRSVRDGKEVPGTVKIRIAPRSDLPGKTVFHCHIVPHQDTGMMTAISFDPPGSPPVTASTPPLPPQPARHPSIASEGGQRFPLLPLVPEEPPLVPLNPPQAPPTLALTQHICLPRSPHEPHPQGSFAPPKQQFPRCDPQTVPVGAHVQVQLPGTPSQWTLAKHTPNLLRLGERQLPSPGRIRGTNELYVFDFLALTPGEAGMTFTESPAFIASTGEFEYPLRVVEVITPPVPSPFQALQPAAYLRLRRLPHPPP